jgi:hypothetical protein
MLKKLTKKLTGPFKTKTKKKARKEEEDPLCPVIYDVGRLEANSLCAAYRSNDFTALFSSLEAYIA